MLCHQRLWIGRVLFDIVSFNAIRSTERERLFENLNGGRCPPYLLIRSAQPTDYGLSKGFPFLSKELVLITPSALIILFSLMFPFS